MSTVKVTYRIDRSGRVVSDAEPPPDYIPWEGAEIVVRRREADYGPDFVRPRDTITVAAGTDGRGSFWLAPGRYTITLPTAGVRRIERHQGTDYDVTVSADLGEIDLSSLLAGGIEPDDPQYPTLLSQLREDLDAEMAEHMEEIEAGKEAAAQSAADAAQARDAAQGYATAAQGYATTASEAAEDAETARDAVLNLVPDPSEEPDGRVLVTRGGVLAYAPDLAAALAHTGLHPQRHFAYDVFSEGEGNFPETGDTAASGQEYTRVSTGAQASVFAVVPDAPESLAVRYWAYNRGNQSPVVILKYIDAGNHLYIENSGTGGIRIAEYVDGVRTILASANPPPGPQRRRLGVEWYGAYLSDGASRTVIARVDTGPEITATPSAIFDGSHAVGIGIGSGSISYAWSVTHLSRQGT